MKANATGAEAQFVPMTEQRLDAVMAVELMAYAKPWKVEHFKDCLQAGYQAQVLMAEQTVLGYFVAMRVHDEVHLLNITVAPQHQGQGWARVMLDALAIWARGQGALWLWLEVRDGNARAIEVYQAQGFATVGRRKRYYPTAEGPREDALVMSKRLDLPAPDSVTMSA
jgi:ribosomal-protein-alanine N-acetyltransferase